MSEHAASLDALVADLPSGELFRLANRLAGQVGCLLTPDPSQQAARPAGDLPGAVVRVAAKAAQHRALANGFRKKLLKGAVGVSVQDATNADAFAQDLEAVLAGLAEASAAEARWMGRVSDIREASGLGVVPMLSELPGAIGAMRGALEEAEVTLRLVESPAHEDALYGAEVRALGERIGYGALMAAASAAWREKLSGTGRPGGEFVAGPCHSSVVAALAQIRKALKGISTVADLGQADAQ